MVSIIITVWQEQKLMVLEGKNNHQFSSVPYDRGNNLRHSMDVVNTKYDVNFDLQGKFFSLRKSIQISV